MADFTRRRILAAGSAAAALGLAGVRPAFSQSTVDFAGETVEWWMPFSEGGGSITGSNEFVARARPDGLAILGTSGSTQFPFLLGDPRVRYDYAKLIPVLVSPTGGVCYLPSKFEVKSPADLGKLKDQELVYGSQGATSLDLVPMLAFRLLGLNVRHVFGMKGRGDGRLAFERGEATIDYQTSSAYLTNVVPLVEAGTAVPMFSWGILDAEGNVARDPTFPDLPHFVEAYEMMHGSKPSGVEFDAYRSFFGSGFAAQKPCMLPEGTPDDIVATYRKAFADAVADPELQKAKVEVLGDYKQAVGDDIQRLYEVATTISPDARSWVREFLTKEYSVRF